MGNHQANGGRRDTTSTLPASRGRWADGAVLPRRGAGGGAAVGRDSGDAGSGRHRPKMAEYVQLLKRAMKHLGGHGGVRGALWQLLR